MSQETQKSIRKNVLFNPKLIKKGLFYFISISIITFVLIFLYTNTGNTLDIWKSLNLKYILICLCLVGIDLWLGGYRNHIFIKELKPGLSQWVSFRANLANFFMGSITPSQAGGGLAQLYLYHKHEVKVSDAITLGFINWVSTLIFFPISGFLAYQIISDKIPEGYISHLAQFGFFIFLLLSVVIFIALYTPESIGNFIQWISSILIKINKKWTEKLTSFGEKAKTSLVDYRNKCLQLLYRKPYLLFLSFLITILLYFNKYVLGYFIILSFGVEADFWVVIALQSIIYLLLYFAPSPGGSGIAEISIAGLMAGVLSEDYLTSFTLIQRTMLMYIPSAIGAYVVLKLLKEEAD